MWKQLKYRYGMNSNHRKDIARSPAQARMENYVHNVTKVDIPKKIVGEHANFASDTIIQVINAIISLKRRKPQKKLIKHRK